MQDRVSLYPGRVTLTPVAGQANTYDMERADSPTQAGTPLSKASLLKDATAAMYGLPNTAVPDEVFQKIAKKDVFKVGDTLQTVRTNLGDKWLLCNGASIKVVDYPELVAAGLTEEPIEKTLIYNISNTKNICEYNGTYVIVGTYNGYPYILSTTDIKGTWTLTQLATKSGYTPVDIVCNNGTWAIVIQDLYNTGFFVYYSTDPTGTWSATRVTNYGVTATSITFYNGTWAICAVAGQMSSYKIYIFYANSLSGTWTNSTAPGKYAEPSEIRCFNGVWTFLAHSNNDDNFNPYIFTTASVGGEWTKTKMSDTKFCYPQKITYHNGRWVVVGYVTENSSNYPYVWSATNLTGTWTEKKIDTSVGELHGIVYANNRWIAVGSTTSNKYPLMATATNINTEWECVKLSTVATPLYDIIEYPDGVLAVGHRSTGEENLNYPCIYYTGYATLPTISVDGVYTYIKAKE